MLSRIVRAVGGLTVLAAVFASPARAAAPGGFSTPSAGATLTPGSVVETRWRVDRAIAARDADEAELVLSLDGGRTFAVRVSAELPPGATSYRWRVPSLPTRTARLALRLGEHRERKGERIAFLSAEFAIAGEAAAQEALAAGPDEAWTEQALTERTPGDLLGGALRSDGERIVSAEGQTDAVNPNPAPTLTAPASRATTTRSSRVSRASLPRRVSRPASGFLPLRI